MKLTDEMLYQYAGEARDVWLSTLPQRDEIPEHQFSRRFQRKMHKLFRQQNRSPQCQRILRYARNAAIFTLVLTGVTFAGLMTVEAYRGAVIDIISSKIDDTLTKFQYSSTISEENAEFVDINFTYMPKGLEENELGFHETTINRHRQFESSDRKIVELDEELITADRDFSMGVVTEGKIAEEHFMIGEEEATLIAKTDDTCSTGLSVSIIWTRNDVAYSFWTNLSIEEAKKIVLGIEYLPYDAQKAKAKREAEEAELKAKTSPDTVMTRDYLLSFVDETIRACERELASPPVDEAYLEEDATVSYDEYHKLCADFLSKVKPFYEDAKANATDENAFDYWEEYWEIRGEPAPEGYCRG